MDKEEPKKPNAEIVLSMIDSVLLQNKTEANKIKIKKITKLLNAYYKENE